jgi:phytoene desaturase
MSKKKHALVIGSGIGGLALSIRLAVQGFDVDVYEANENPGGKLTEFIADGFRFDAGPSLFTQPENIAELFELANEPIDQYFKYTSVETVCHYFFENGIRIQTFADKDQLAKEFEVKLGENPNTILQYLNDAQQTYNNIGSIFLNYSLHQVKTWLHPRVFRAFKTLRFGHLFQSMHQFNRARFKTEEAVQLFNRFATYNGSNPYQAPGMLTMIPHLEQNQGTYYPYGGMISITNALHQLALKKGVKFHFKHKVEKILHQSGKTSGIIVNGKTVLGDIVVSNADVHQTYKSLLNDESQTKRIEKIERSSSALIFYWGIKKSFPELGLHNIFFSKNYPAEFDALFTKKTLIDDPTVYVNITSKMERGMAPEDGENWFVMINAPTNHGQNWDQLIEQARKNIQQKLSKMLGQDIRSLIETEQILDPVQIEQKTGTYQGSLYGTSSNSIWSAFLRPPNASKSIQGLYFCGGTVHPGGGIPLCLKSASITANQIISKYNPS